jgi:hypothetical protein
MLVFGYALTYKSQNVDICKQCVCSLPDSNKYHDCSCAMIIWDSWTKQLFSNNFIIFLECFFFLVKKMFPSILLLTCVFFFNFELQ